MLKTPDITQKEFFAGYVTKINLKLKNQKNALFVTTRAEPKSTHAFVPQLSTKVKD